MQSTDEVATFVDDRRIALLTGSGAVASLPDAIAGRGLTGSWWSQPEAGLIYQLLEAAEDQGLGGAPLLASPLVTGKQAVIAAPLAAAVARIASDPGRVGRCDARRCDARRSSLATALLELVEAEGSVRMDDPRVAGPSGREARLELERSLVARSSSVHTESGRHVSILEPWATSPIAELGRPRASSRRLRRPAPASRHEDLDRRGTVSARNPKSDLKSRDSLDIV